MKWEVIGASRATGEDVQTVVEAETNNQASEAANMQGIIVAEVKEYTGTPLAKTKIESPKPRPKSPVLPPSGIPEYRGLRIMAFIFYLNCAIALVLGLLAIGSAIVGNIFLLNDDVTKRADLLQDLIGGIGLLFYAALSAGISQFFTAFRDIARNSFKK